MRDVVTLVLVALLHVPEARDAMHVGGLFERNGNWRFSDERG
jgi:hypothetical protein